MAEYAQWVPAHPIIYSAASDETIATEAQKIIAETNRIYELLTRIRTHDASNGTIVDDAVPYQFKIDTVHDEIFMRSKDNESWIFLGKIAPNFGISANTVGAVPTSGGITSLTAGLDADKPLAADSKKDDWYLAIDQKKLYHMGDTDWELILSLNVANLLGYEDIVTKADVSSTAAAEKIPKADNNGKINFDTTGNAAKIANKAIDDTSIADGRVLVYRDSVNAFVFEAKGGGGSGGGSDIDDGNVSTGTTYSSHKIVDILSKKQDITGTLDAFSCTYDADGELHTVTTGDKTYTVLRDENGRLDTISDGTLTSRALYNSAGQFLGMEVV